MHLQHPGVSLSLSLSLEARQELANYLAASLSYLLAHSLDLLENFNARASTEQIIFDLFRCMNNFFVIENFLLKINRCRCGNTSQSQSKPTPDLFFKKYTHIFRLKSSTISKKYLQAVIEAVFIGPQISA